ncbi:tripartite tricarboxylate transporter substrate binding protein [Achromobacter sp. F4_2707]|uniref:Bug family tripartite tricarboxylate transporter substrate binding protein n=1 Tax=Achromobacter sp. F4_2707 TaxID=3114286 RepID=UPI0039C5C97D
MQPKFTQLAYAVIAAAALLPLAAQAQADSYPDRAITMVVPFPPGGPTDLVARVLSKQLNDQLGQPVVVENKGGANGTIGMQAVANAKPDGYTILYNTSSISLSPNLYSKLPFDPEKDFAPISSTAVVPMVLLTHPSVPADTVQEFIEYARKNPRALSYASAGNGNVTHLTAFLFTQSTGIEAVHIPYRGSAPGMTDLVSGQVQFMANTLNDSLPFVRQGRVKALAITSAQRSELLPDVPTLAESVMPGYESGAWQGVVAPTDTPDAVINRLNEEIRTALKSDLVREQLSQQGAQILGSTPADYRQYISDEISRWGEVIRAAGVKLD